jgi:hypothetical protein
MTNICRQLALEKDLKDMREVASLYSAAIVANAVPASAAMPSDTRPFSVVTSSPAWVAWSKASAACSHDYLGAGLTQPIRLLPWTNPVVSVNWWKSSKHQPSTSEQLTV